MQSLGGEIIQIQYSSDQNYVSSIKNSKKHDLVYLCGISTPIIGLYLTTLDHKGNLFIKIYLKSAI